MKYETSWTRPGEGSLQLEKFLKEADLQEAISLKWKQIQYDNPQRFETEYKGYVVWLEWNKVRGAEMRLFGRGPKGKGGERSGYDVSPKAMSVTKEVATAVAKHFYGQRKIFVHNKIFSTKVSGYKNRAPDDYTTYRPGWKKNWSFSA